MKNCYKCNQKIINSNNEDICVEVYVKNRKLLFYTLYRPPNILIDFNNHFKQLFNSIDITFYDFLCVLGDMNIDFTQHFNRLSNNAIQLKQTLLAYGLTQIVTNPTFPSNDPKSILDLIFINDSDLFDKLSVVSNIAEICDHKSLLFSLIITKNRKPFKRISKYDLNEENLQLLNEKLFSVDWVELTKNVNDINTVYSLIKQNYLEIFEKTIPKVTKYSKNIKNFNKTIRNLIKKRRNLVKYSSNSKNFSQIYRSLTERIGLEIEIFENKKITNIIEKSDNFHSLYKSIKLLNKSTNQMSFTDENGFQITDNLEIVEKFKNIFESKFSVNYNNIHKNELKIDYQMSESLIELNIEINDILLSLKKFKYNKSQGKTFIDNIIIKKCLNGVSVLLLNLFNKIINLREIPNDMKLSVVSPVLKHNKNKNLFSSYRCVSVQPNIYRIFELILLNKLTPFLNINRIIPDIQFGYKKYSFLSDIHMNIQNIVFNSLIDTKVRAIDIVFLDLSDAFDTVSHPRMLYKLDFYGINGIFGDILGETFKNRKQIVKYNECFSSEFLQKSGVLQGGVLSPILFNIYIADIIHGITSFIFKFADDICMVRPIYALNDCQILQKDLDSIYKFCELNSLKINASKCESLRIGNRICDNFSYNINNIVISFVDNHKHIGVIYDTTLSFNSQIDVTVEKSLKKFSILKVICRRVDYKTFLKLYVTYIRPILEFSNLSIVLTQTQSDKLESVQRKVTKYICFKSNKIDLSYDDRLKYLKMPSLKKRREIQVLGLVYKTLNNLFKIKNKYSNHLTFYETSRNGIFCKIPTNYKTKDFFIFSAKLFNSLPKYVRNEKHFSKFKSHLDLVL